MTSSFLNEIFPLGEYTTEEQQTIIQKFKKVTFTKNSVLLPHGNTANYYWFVESGFLRSYAIDIDGNDITTNFFSGGDIVIDWPSFFMRTPTKENIEASEDCICWQLDFETFQQLFHSIIAFREAGRSRLIKSYFELKNHRVSLITDQAKSRYLRLLEDKPYIVRNAPLKQIASYLGVTDTSLSRIRREIASNR